MKSAIQSRIVAVLCGILFSIPGIAQELVKAEFSQDA